MEQWWPEGLLQHGEDKEDCQSCAGDWEIQPGTIPQGSMTIASTATISL
jgi:hypothetical protein